jgi:hypothetical protein
VVNSREGMVENARRSQYSSDQGHTEEAQYWDAPGNVISDFKVAFAVVTGDYPDAGKNRKVQL